MQQVRPKRALVVADGDLDSASDLANGWALIVAADGGLAKAERVGLEPQLVVGDGDSLTAEVLARLQRDGVEVVLHSREKDASDTELAIRAAVDRGATEVVLAGALGGARADHALANLLLLAAPDIRAQLTLVDGRTTVRVIGRYGPEKLDIDGAPGDLLTLLALSDEVCGVTLAGLAYPLQGATLRQGSTLGLSNELADRHATVSVDSGRLAVIHTASEVTP